MRTRRKQLMSVIAVGLAVSLLGVAAWRIPREVTTLGGTALVGQDTPAFPKPPNQLSYSPPEEVVFAEQDDEESDRPFFDDFAWRDFIALNWPALEDQRGEPDAKKQFGDTSGPIVWGSWKSLGELYPPDARNTPPTPWNRFEAVVGARRTGPDRKSEYVPLKDLQAQQAGKLKVLRQISKLEDINQAGTPGEEPRFPLVAQNQTFVRYETRVNRIEYEYMLGKALYLSKNLPRPDPRHLELREELPAQSITVRAAWRELPVDNEVRKRFYHVTAKVLDWAGDGTPILQDREMGLVGLHIVHKTPKRRNWIWMTFEHVDNTELSSGRIQLASLPSFNSKAEGMSFDTPGTNLAPPMVKAGEPIPKAPQPVNVARKNPIPLNTQKVNQAYWNHPQIKDTVWRNYRLVATQWPRPLDNPQSSSPSTGDELATRRLPADGVANVTMETYHQSTGCMNCHAATSQVKMVFYPELRAIAENTAAANQAVERVQKLLEKAADKPRPK